jgi:hypothetical protein
MDFPAALTPDDGPTWGRKGAILAFLGLLLYALLLAWNEGAGAGGSDSSGYTNQARLLSAGSVHAPLRAIPGLAKADTPPFLYVPLGFKPAPNGNGMVPTYPTGFSLFMLALRPVAGWRYAGAAAIILNSIGGLVATYLLGRKLGLGRNWSVLGAALIAASPLYLFMSLMAMSDVPSLLWTTLAVLAALTSRDRPLWALCAGAAIAVDVLLRPTNVLAFLPAALALGASPRRWLLFVMGGLPGAVFLGAHSVAAYGSLLATGYGDTSEDFGARYVAASAAHCALWLPMLFTPVVVLCAGLPWIRSVPASARWLLGVWILAFAGFYSAYKCTHETWWYLRFLLPTVPPLVVGSLLVLRRMCMVDLAVRNRDLGAAWLAAALAVAAGCSEAVSHYVHPLYLGRMERQYERVTDWMEQNLPGNAVCLTMQASGAIFCYTDYTFIRWDFVNKGNVGQIESAIRASGKPLFAVLFPFEYNETRVLDTRMPGRWNMVGKVGDIAIMRRDFGPPKT